ncbi:MAG: response regulator [Desulfobacteraceae bacterium]|nr:response regulator [Desulfobacteraceae bacterium]MCB9494659.1 response regulator [Desulfobacteraceae bacterium]
MTELNEKEPLVMAVDDNSKNLQVVGKILGKNGYNLSLVGDGQTALKLAKEKQPDLILLDIMMPVMDGFEVCSLLKKDEITKNIPVIFLTAKTGEDDIVKGFETGGVDYITKPFNHRELLARVNTHVELKRSREEIKTLKGFIPICACCKKIRDDKGFWEDVEKYVEERSYAKFSHGMCPDCVKSQYPDIYEKIEKKK